MTWDQFKKLVDDELQKRGYDGSVEVDWIDCDKYVNEDDIEVSSGHLTISA